MAEIIKERMTAEADGDFVVFLIGMRINNLWKINKWLPVVMAMPKMLNELYNNPDTGFISHEQWFGRTTIMVQYWKSFEQLESYAKNTASNHLPAWANYNNQLSASGDVGIWHETYLARQETYECVYNNMPRFGLAKAMGSFPATGQHQTASSRINRKNNKAD